MREEDALQVGAVVQPVDLVDDVAAEVELGQRVEPLQVVHCLYQVVGEVQDSEVTQVIDIFDSTNFIRVQV